MLLWVTVGSVVSSLGDALAVMVVVCCVVLLRCYLGPVLKLKNSTGVLWLIIVDLGVTCVVCYLVSFWLAFDYVCVATVRLLVV